MMEVEKGGFFMKCPHCGVHYDDGDRECPMCGARKPVFRSDPSPLARSTGKLAEAHRKEEKTSWVGEHMTKTCAHPKKKDCPHTTTLNGRPQKKKKGKGWIIILIVILINILPAILGAIGDIVEEFTDDFREGFAEDFGVIEPAVPDQDIWDESWQDETLPVLGVWGVPDTRAQAVFSQTMDEEYGLEQYGIAVDSGYQERGVYWWYECTEEDGIEFPEDFPASEYRWYSVEMIPYDISGEAPNPQADLDEIFVNDYFIEVFQSRTDSAETYFYGWGVPWLPEDSMAFAQYVGGAEQADVLLSSAERV